jgi:hypothetical protein
MGGGGAQHVAKWRRKKGARLHVRATWWGGMAVWHRHNASKEEVGDGRCGAIARTGEADGGCLGYWAGLNEQWSLVIIQKYSNGFENI